MLEALESSWISGGEFVDKFEAGLKSLHRCEDAVTVTNGTSALHLAYLALGLGPGDEIIVPGFTFAAPANMALAIGAKPVFVDVDPKTWLINPDEIERKISPKTKAIVVVHLYGFVAAMDRVLEIADKYRLFVVEDTAEALFSKYGDKFAGTVGDIGCLSFHSTKTITTGEGGAVLFNSREHAELGRLYRNHGMRPHRKYWHEVVGHNFRMTNIQAALGCGQLERADYIISDRLRIFQEYAKRLRELPCDLQTKDPKSQTVLWAQCVRLRGGSNQRNQVIEKLAARGIETRPGFISFDRMPIYDSAPLPVSSNLSDSVLSLPTFTSMPEDAIQEVCEALSIALKETSS